MSIPYGKLIVVLGLTALASTIAPASAHAQNRGGARSGGARAGGGVVVGRAVPRQGPVHVAPYGVAPYRPYYYAPYYRPAYGYYYPGFSLGFSFGYPGFYSFGGFYGYPYPYGAYAYPYGGYPYAYGGYGYGAAYGGVRIDVPQRNGQVFVDGYFAGVVDNFDGVLQHLDLTPGAHHIEVRAEGQEPMSFDVNVQAGNTITYRPEKSSTQP